MKNKIDFLIECATSLISEARMKMLKVNGKEQEGVLMAGGPSFKIYSTADGLVLSIGRKNYFFHEGNSEYKTIINYVNFKYYDSDKQKAIKDEFDKLVQKLKGKTNIDESELMEKLNSKIAKKISFEVDDEDSFYSIVAMIDGEEVGSILLDNLYSDSIEQSMSPYEDLMDKKNYDKLIGNDEMIEIQSISVEDEYQKMGIGVELMNAAVKYLKKSHSSTPVFVNASTMGDMSQDKLVSFYKSFGFKNLGDFDKNSALFIDSARKLKTL
jgi:GNAT superfamily N-acetyltransferase